MLLLDKEVRKIAAMVMEEGISLRSAVVIARLEYYFLSRLAEERWYSRKVGEREKPSEIVSAPGVDCNIRFLQTLKVQHGQGQDRPAGPRETAV